MSDIMSEAIIVNFKTDNTQVLYLLPVALTSGVGKSLEPLNHDIGRGLAHASGKTENHNLFRSWTTQLFQHLNLLVHVSYMDVIQWTRG